MNKTARSIITLAAAFAALALPGAAFAREGESGGGGKRQVAEVVSGQTDDAATGEHATETEAAEPTEKTEPTEPTEAEAGDDKGVDADTEADDKPIVPELAPAFLRRSWKFQGTADGYDAESHVLAATIEKLAGGPRKLRRARRALLDFDAAVLVGTRTRVVGEDGHRVAAADAAEALDAADEVQVTGKFLKPAKWQDDEDGAPLATVRAKRIRITG